MSVHENGARLVVIGRIAEGCSPSPWMISRRRYGDGGVGAHSLNATEGDHLRMTAVERRRGDDEIR
jgi:hypothetical protein